MTKFSAIVFDFDGVLVESVAVKGEAFCRLYESESREVQDRVLAWHKANGGVSRYDKIRHFETVILGRSVDEKKVMELADRFSSLVMECVIASPWVNGAREFVEKYHRELPLYIASATPQDELLEIVAARRMENYFQGVFGSPDKKDSHLKAIIKDNNYDPSRVLMVGDALSDYDAAKSAGTAFIGRRTPGYEVDFPGAPVMNDLGELESLIA